MHKTSRGCTDFPNGSMNKLKEGKNLCLDHRSATLHFPLFHFWMQYFGVLFSPFERSIQFCPSVVKFVRKLNLSVGQFVNEKYYKEGELGHT